MRMRTVFAVGMLAVALIPGEAATQSTDPGKKSLPFPPDVLPKIDLVVRPLAMVPAIVEDGSTLAIELDPERALTALDPATLSVELVPSFGAARVPVDVEVTEVESNQVSALWADRVVTRITASVPPFGSVQSFVEDLYDLRVTTGAWSDVQPRAVKVVDTFPGNPRIVVIADPSVGDPRPIQEGVEEDLLGEEDVDALVRFVTRTFEVGGRGRWGALKKTIEEVNLIAPDLVLVTGDLTFGAHPRALPYEYEDAWNILNALRSPTFVTPGNHDLYTLDYYTTDDDDLPFLSDGKEEWVRTFGPLRYAVDVGPNLRLVSMNTFDWTARQPFELPEGDTLSGGQVSDEQLAWIDSVLTTFRAASPDGTILTFAHHDPSWRARRHPWPGANRLELRNLLQARGVAAHFAGHKHNDRVARYHGAAGLTGNVVTTPDQESPDHETTPQLHYMKPANDQLDASFSQAELAGILSDPSQGTLFFTTTTAASGLKGPDWGVGGYWGWRLGTLLPGAGGGLDPADWGYPATRDFLDEMAERPARWNEDHAPLGLFSYPSYHLDEAIEGPNDGTASEVTVTLTSRFATTVDLVVPVSIATSDPEDVTIEGGTLVRSRFVDGRADLWIAVDLPAGSTVVVTTRSAG